MHCSLFERYHRRWFPKPVKFFFCGIQWRKTNSLHGLTCQAPPYRPFPPTLHAATAAVFSRDTYTNTTRLWNVIMCFITVHPFSGNSSWVKSNFSKHPSSFTCFLQFKPLLITRSKLATVLPTGSPRLVALPVAHPASHPPAAWLPEHCPRACLGPRSPSPGTNLQAHFSCCVLSASVLP